MKDSREMYKWFFRDGNMRGFTDMKNKLGFVIISFDSLE